MERLIIALVLFSFSLSTAAQNAVIKGSIYGPDGPLSYATIVLDEERSVFSDDKGKFAFKDIKQGTYPLQISYLGYQNHTINIEVSSKDIDLGEIIMKPELMLFDEIVVTGTKTFKRKTKSAVIVNVVDAKTLDNIQACNLSEGLKFQPGLRVETDCQTCNYTQLRINGLSGGYSQILINGRPIFSPLTGLYGLEQLPVNMIDKIEVIRGGGSSLYGSSAIGGTVNVLTKIPQKSSLSINSMLQSIQGQASDRMIDANGSLVTPNKKIGTSLFLNYRDRDAYDHNSDGFSELPAIENTSFGLSSFWLPTTQQKVELSVTRLNEYRLGGELSDLPVYLLGQAEERTHEVWMVSLDHQINFDQGSLITYASWQNTDREHFTGIFPDEEEQAINYTTTPPYGDSRTRTLQVGVQANYEIKSFLNGSNVLTVGSEYLYDQTYDEIKTYEYLIDQTTKNAGLFFQSDWEILPALNLLSGSRLDVHNLLERPVISPRVNLLYKFIEYGQLRAGYGSGFRAPQAFDTDLHIAFAGGGVSRVILDPNLIEERSRSYNLSINYDRPSERWIAGFTVEAFSTSLKNAFILESVGEDDFGEIFIKRNGQRANVQGVTFEGRMNFNKKIQVETSWTSQRSQYSEPVQYIDGIPGTRRFIRTPNHYGFVNTTWTPDSRLKLNANFVYTGSMVIPHFAGAPNQLQDEMTTTPDFADLSFKLSYLFKWGNSVRPEWYAGMKNLFNSYQDDFDIGKNRDSNYVYGPSLPRTFYTGIKLTL